VGLFHALVIDPPIPIVDGYLHVAVAVFISRNNLDFGSCGKADGAALIGFRTLLGQRCSGVRIRRSPACAGNASWVMTPGLAMAAPNDAASASVTGTIFKMASVIFCMMLLEQPQSRNASRHRRTMPHHIRFGSIASH
jgi:hypothetical protein